jgi:hypothetical protein
MVQPGMTEGTKPDAAPEAVRLDLDPGRNVDQARLSAGPLSNAEKRAEARENAQAADRREASPASYKGPERTRDRPSLWRSSWCW